MKKYDLLGILFWLFVAIYICIESVRQLPLGSWKNPGAGFFPLGTGILLGFFSLVAIVNSLRDKSVQKQAHLFPGEKWKNIAIVLATLFLYVLLVGTLGFLICTTILMAILFRAVEPQKWTITLAGSAIASVVCYLLFESWLQIQLPKGIWGF